MDGSYLASSSFVGDIRGHESSNETHIQFLSLAERVLTSIDLVFHSSVGLVGEFPIRAESQDCTNAEYKAWIKTSRADIQD